MSEHPKHCLVTPQQPLKNAQGTTQNTLSIAQQQHSNCLATVKKLPKTLLQPPRNAKAINKNYLVTPYQCFSNHLEMPYQPSRTPQQLLSNHLATTQKPARTPQQPLGNAKSINQNLLVLLRPTNHPEHPSYCLATTQKQYRSRPEYHRNHLEMPSQSTRTLQ